VTALSPLGIPGKLSPTGWAPPEDLTYEQWEYAGLAFRTFHKAVEFAIGDWIRVGEARFGEMYSQAVDAADYEGKTFRNWVWVAGKIEMSRRRDNLRWSHHEAVAALPADQQDQFLDTAEAEGLSVRALRLLINPKQDDPPKPLEPGQAQCPKCQFRFRLSGNNHLV
jgi:hypothetical protein